MIFPSFYMEGLPKSVIDAFLHLILEKEIEILIELNDGEAAATAWGCDLTHEYVNINADYRS